MEIITPGVTPSAPVPAAAPMSVEDRIMRHVENTPIPGSDAERRRNAPQPAPAAPAPEPAEAAPAEGAEPAEAAEENFEFDYDGDRYQVPAKLKTVYEAWEKRESQERDYTQKSQETAEKMRSAEALMQQAAQQQALHQAVAPHVATLQGINQAIDQYKKVDWAALIDQNLVEAQKHQARYQMLKDQKAELEQAITQTAQAHVAKINENMAKIREATNKILAQKIKGWTPERSENLNKFVKQTYGFNDTEVSTTVDARVIEMMHDAQSWRELQATKAQKVVPSAPKTLKPSASERVNAAQAKQGELKKAIRLAKTPSEKARAIQTLLESRVR